MPVRWDALLVHHLARELDARQRGARLRALRLDSESGDAALLFREVTLLWRLHPSRGYPVELDATEPGEADLKLAAKLKGVRAPADERLLVFELHAARGPAVDVIVELMDNQWNVVAVEQPGGVIRHVLRRREGKRPLRVGARYAPPAASGRAGAEEPLSAEEWAALVAELAALPARERSRALVSRVAWTSSLNAKAILGAEVGVRGVPPLLHVAREGDAASPVLLEAAKGLQPYPFPLADTPSWQVESLVAGFAALARAEEGGAGLSAALLPAGTLEALERTVEQAHRRAASLEAELASAEDPVDLRALGDLLLARYADVAPGAAEVELTDFEGRPVRLALDPARPVHENADGYYERARRAERARERLPGLVARAQRRAAGLEEVLARARRGEADPDELVARLGPAPARGSSRAEPEPLPYRRYRSSGGLEIRVGKGARHNDDLTFRHSSPGDVWLHARHAAGAHVVLRWQREGNPPRRDLEEAAVLAALHSKAATSGSVPVDWTFRKYVRKPRGSGPGSVVIEREKTLFVRPDRVMEERLREEEW